MPFFRGSSQPWDQTHVSSVSCFGRWVLYHQQHLGNPSIYMQINVNILRGRTVSITSINFFNFLPIVAREYLLCIPGFIVLHCFFSLNPFWKWKLAAQSCPTLCDPMDCNPPGSPDHGILQARKLEWVAISFSRGSSWHRHWTWMGLQHCRQILYHLNHQGTP